MADEKKEPVPADTGSARLTAIASAVLGVLCLATSTGDKASLGFVAGLMNLIAAGMALHRPGLVAPNLFGAAGLAGIAWNMSGSAGLLAAAIAGFVLGLNAHARPAKP